VIKFHYIGAVDLGLVHDLSARAVGHWDSEQGVVVIDATRMWQGTRISPVKIADVEKDIWEVWLNYKTRKIVLDPWQMMSTAQRFGNLCEPQPITAQYRQQISEAFYQQVAAERISLPYDEYLREQLLELVHSDSASGYKLEAPQGGHDDLALTLMMIVHWFGANIKGSGRISFGRIGGGPPSAARQPLPGEGGTAQNMLRQMQEERRRDDERKEVLGRPIEEMLDEVGRRIA